LAKLCEFDALLIEPRVFLKMRNEESEHDDILEKLEGLGFKVVNRVRTSRFVFLTRA
jgi:seryl-tRNA synthetase